MKFENTLVTGFESAVLGLRLPMCVNLAEAIKKLDSKSVYDEGVEDVVYVIGEDDMRICKNLIKADSKGGGQPNSKFLRMIHVQVAVTAPLYWWKEFDTYKVGTVANSTSTMHKLASTPITKECFEMDDFEDVKIFRKINYLQEEWETSKDFWGKLIPYLEQLRIRYNEVMENKKHLEEIKEFEEAKKAQVMAKKYWKELIRLLPESWLQTRMLDLNYATLRNIYAWRHNHKLTEWHTFCDWIKTLPYAEEFLISE